MSNNGVLAKYDICVNDLLKWIDNRGVKPLVLVITGSWMWGTSTETSDLDIRGIYIQPTRDILSLHVPADTIEANKVLSDKVDIQLYEVAKVMRMLLNGNGNIVEMLLSPTMFYDLDAEYNPEWSHVARKFLTKKLYKYYEGFYHSQRQRAAKNRGSKALVYAARELMAGTWLMSEGEIICDFWELRELYQQRYSKLPLLDEFLKRENWNTPVADDKIKEFEAEWEHMTEIMKNERDASELPEKEPADAYDQLNTMLLTIRKEN